MRNERHNNHSAQHWLYNIILHVIYILMRSFDSPRLGLAAGTHARTHTHTQQAVLMLLNVDVCDV